ncbi:MAG: hypothetical protein Q9227_005632 [Pyrenula ochraceoflavens]
MSNSTSTDTQTAFYHYEPSLAAASAFCGLFAITTFLQAYQTLLTRAWYLIPLLLGGLCEVIGFIGRILNSNESPHYSLTPYIIQSILLLIAPALLSASVYMVLGYIILSLSAEHHSLIREKLLTKLFVLGDFLSFMIQSTGASLLTKKNDPDAKTFSKYIIVGGLAIQLLFFAYFMLITVVFYRRVCRAPTPLSSPGSGIPWRKHLFILFLASILIMIRSVFRVVEYLEGDDGYLLGHEWSLYVFDSALMFLVTLIFNVEHPTQITARTTTGRKAARHLVRLERVEKVGGGGDATSYRKAERPPADESDASDGSGVQMLQPSDVAHAV